MKLLKYSSLALFLCSSLTYAESSQNNELSSNHTYEKKKPDSHGIEITNGWLFLGDLRAGWIEYDYGNKPPADSSINREHTDSHGFYVMPKLSIMSPKYNGLSTKITMAGATDFGMNDEKYEDRNFVFGPDRESFAILQEAYISYEKDGHKALVGREELVTPMIESDDYYMLADSFEVAYYQYSDIENITLCITYFHKMSGVWDSGADGTEFHSMSDASFVSQSDKDNADDSGIISANFEYNDNKNHNLQVWNYYARDLYNTFFAQYDWTSEGDGFNYNIGFQVIDFKEVGELKSNNFTKIDYTIYSARFDIDFDNGFDIATGIANFTDGEGQGATLGAWGGYPYFANGMIFHFFEAGNLQNASSYKAQLGYDLSKIGLKNTWFGYRYTYFDLDSSYSFAKDSAGNNDINKKQSKMVLNGVRLSYSGKSGAYFTGTYEHENLDNEPNTCSLRLIGGYKF